MRKHFIRKSIIEQMICLKKNFAQAQEKVFKDVFSLEKAIKGLNQEGTRYRNRIFSPVVTLQYFLIQILSADHSCREAVSQRVAELTADGQEGCSSNTASYCNARKRLPLDWVMSILRDTGGKLHEVSLKIWRNRPVKLVDGTTASMPDTVANQRRYPQNRRQKKGVGFPIVRIVGIISLSCGAVLDVAMGACEGEGNGEHGLLRRLLHNFKKTTLWWETVITVHIG